MHLWPTHANAASGTMNADSAQSTPNENWITFICYVSERKFAVRNTFENMTGSVKPRDLKYRKMQSCVAVSLMLAL